MDGLMVDVDVTAVVTREIDSRASPEIAQLACQRIILLAPFLGGEQAKGVAKIAAPHKDVEVAREAPAIWARRGKVEGRSLQEQHRNLRRDEDVERAQAGLLLDLCRRPQCLDQPLKTACVVKSRIELVQLSRDDGQQFMILPCRVIKRISGLPFIPGAARFGGLTECRTQQEFVALIGPSSRQ